MNITCPGCQENFLCNVEKCVKEQCTSKLHYSTLNKNRNENEQKTEEVKIQNEIKGEEAV